LLQKVASHTLAAQLFYSITVQLFYMTMMAKHPSDSDHPQTMAALARWLVSHLKTWLSPLVASRQTSLRLAAPASLTVCHAVLKERF
jgi:hypothetical protein